jgi:hypothetical protein
MVDRISALPDELLMHILTFLPTKHAFTTIVLSKRWTPLCHFLTVLHVLHFDDEGAQDKHASLRFRRYVDAFMLSKHHPIGTMRLISRSKRRDSYNRQFNMDEWLEAAIRRHIKNLELSTARSRPLPPRVLTSQTLTVLKLKGFDLRFGDNNIVSVDLPSLKTLHLEKPYLEKVDNLIELLSGCLNLVDLSASAVLYLEEHVESTTRYEFFTLPKLEKACICALVFLPFTVISNVKFLRIINTGYLGVSEHMPMFQNLINIELCFGTFLGWHDVQKLLPYCPKLQTLVIQKVRRLRLFFCLSYPIILGIYLFMNIIFVLYLTALRSHLQKEMDIYRTSSRMCFISSKNMLYYKLPRHASRF